MLKQNIKQLIISHPGEDEELLFEVEDIKQLKTNHPGEDYVVGDIHGSLECFKAACTLLQPNDRLFIVGDLADRGPHSAEVILKVSANKKRFFAVRGNHESLCLDTLDNLVTIIEDILTIKPKHLPIDYQTKPDVWRTNRLRNLKKGIIASQHDNSLARDIVHHMKQGGEWLVDLFQNELDSGKINILNNSEYNISIEFDDSKVNQIQEYLESLPYIIKVSGDKPFCVVHADMPFSDDELSNRIKAQNYSLSIEEKIYATWARDRNLLHHSIYCKNQGRGPESIPSFVGHNIFDYDGVSSYRAQSNTYNIDTGAYLLGALMIVNVTKNIVEFVGNDHANYSDKLIRGFEEVKHRLKLRLELESMLLELKSLHYEHFYKESDFFISLERAIDKNANYQDYFGLSKLQLIGYAHHHEILTADEAKKLKDMTLNIELKHKINSQPINHEDDLPLGSYSVLKFNEDLVSGATEDEKTKDSPKSEHEYQAATPSCNRSPLRTLPKM